MQRPCKRVREQLPHGRVGTGERRVIGRQIDRPDDALWRRRTTEPACPSLCDQVIDGCAQIAAAIPTTT